MMDSTAQHTDISRRSTVGPLALASTLLLLLSAPLAAAADPGGQEESAAELRREARAMVESGQSHAEAARYLVRETLQLEASDSDKGTNLRLASRMYHFAALDGKAYWTMMDAGSVLYRAGLKSAATHAFVDAAELAAKADRTSRAWKAARMAGTIVREGALSPSERRSVLRRLRHHASALVG